MQASGTLLTLEGARLKIDPRTKPPSAFPQRWETASDAQNSLRVRHLEFAKLLLEVGEVLLQAERLKVLTTDRC